jgi:ankyrin repeat protein
LGADPNALTAYDGYTPLHLACRGQALKLIELLVTSGANATISDVYGKRAAEYLAVETSSSLSTSMREFLRQQ